MSDEYEHQSYWTKLNERLNEEQESVCVEQSEDGRCLMSLSYIFLDLGPTVKPNPTPPPFCKQIKNTEPYNPMPYDKTI